MKGCTADRHGGHGGGIHAAGGDARSDGGQQQRASREQSPMSVCIMSHVLCAIGQKRSDIKCNFTK